MQMLEDDEIQHTSTAVPLNRHVTVDLAEALVPRKPRTAWMSRRFHQLRFRGQ